MVTIGYSGRPVFYTHTITNKGNFADSFSFSGISSEGWTVQAPSDVLLNPGESTTVQVGLVVPGGVVSGTVDTLTFTAASISNNSFTATVSDETTIQITDHFVYLPFVIKK